MADIIELKATDLAAMLCSRVCHDLINPVGAIGNGLEVLADPTQSAMADGAQELIASAAKQARAKLEFARLAYGASSTAGTEPPLSWMFSKSSTCLLRYGAASGTVVNNSTIDSAPGGRGTVLVN